MKIKSLNDLFVDMLKDSYSAENQLTKALPKMAKKTTNPELKKALQEHLEVTIRQKERLEELCEQMEISPKGKKCAAMEGLVKEAEEAIDEIKDPEVLDAAIIAMCQKVEHYEIASYGTMATFAKILEEKSAGKVLHEILEEEKEADSILTTIAESVVNEKAPH